MIIAINRRTGKLYSYNSKSTYTTDDFLFNDEADFVECISEDDTDHADDFLLFEVTKVFKPEVTYKEITDGEIY